MSHAIYLELDSTRKSSFIAASGYLINSLFYFFPLIFMGDYLRTASLDWYASVLGAYAIFVGLYYGIWYCQDKLRHWLLGAMLLLAVGTTSVFGGTAALFAYIVFIAIFSFSSYFAIAWVCATIVGVVFAASTFTNFSGYFIWPSFIGIVSSVLIATIEVKNIKLRKAAARTSQILERERITRNLHDITGHQLTAIALKSQLAQKYIAKAQYEKATAELADIADLATKNRSAIHNAIEGNIPSDLRAVYLDLIDLLTQQGFTCETSGDLPKIRSKDAPEVAAIMTEAVTNVLRHSDGKSVKITHQQDVNQYRLSVVNSITDRKQLHSNSLGLGLKSMVQRAQTIGGKVDFYVNAQNEAVLSLVLPASLIDQDTGTKAL